MDIGAPTALYYLLHANGVSDGTALVVGAVPVLIGAGYQLLRHRRPDMLGVVVLATMLLSLLTTVISDNPRELLVRTAWLSLPAGLWTLASLRSAQPLCYRITLLVLPGKAAVMRRLYATEPLFRRAFRNITVMWGVVLLADCGLRIAMSYSLPVPTVPALDTTLTVVTVVLLQLPTHYFLWRSGSWLTVFGGRRRPPGPAGLPGQPRYGESQDSGTPASSSASQTVADESDGARQSPRGDSAPPASTFGPFGRADRLNWLNPK